MFLLTVACSDMGSRGGSASRTGDYPSAMTVHSPNAHSMVTDSAEDTQAEAEGEGQAPYSLVKDTSWTTASGERFSLSIKVFDLEQDEVVPYIEIREPCHFRIREQQVPQFAVRLKLHKGDSLLFDRTVRKDVLDGAIDAQFLRKNVLVDADFFAWHPRDRQLVLLFSLAESPGGTAWYAQAYGVLSMAGQIRQCGLVDYPHHCEQLVTLSENREYLLTCCELTDLRGWRHRFGESNSTSALFLNDTLYSVVFALQRDSLLCDTMIYYRDDTLISADYTMRPDTVNSNAFIFHVNGDTMASFQFNGFTNLGETYVTECDLLPGMNMVGYYDYQRNCLRIFDLEHSLKQDLYYVGNLKQLKKQPGIVENEKYFQFNTFKPTGQHQNIRFYVNASRHIIGYSLSVES